MGDRGSTGQSHVARLFKFAPPMCSVRSRTGHGHATRAASSWQLTAVAQPLQGSVTSARSWVPLRVRSITTGKGHLYRADPSSGHQAPMLLLDAGGCDDGSAARRTCSRALSSLADSDPKARSALHIRKEGKSIASTGKPGPNQRTCAFCPNVYSSLQRPLDRICCSCLFLVRTMEQLQTVETVRCRFPCAHQRTQL